MFNYLFKRYYNYFINYYFNLLNFYRFYKWCFLYLYKRIRKYTKRRYKKMLRRLYNPKIFYKICFKYFWIIYFTLIIKPTPTNILLLLKTVYIYSCFFIRNSFYLLYTFDLNYIYSIYYLKINLIVFFFLKLFQEVFLNFRCPIATLLYGRFGRRKRKYKFKERLKQLEEREAKKKLHKFIADPFKTKESRAKIRAEKEKKEMVVGDALLKDLKKLRKIWKKEKTIYKSRFLENYLKKIKKIKKQMQQNLNSQNNYY